MTAAIELIRLVPRTGWSPAPLALTLEVPEGAFCVLEASPAAFGPLLRACVGLTHPAQGSLRVLGLEPVRLGRSETRAFRRRLGVGLRPGGLTSNLTLRMNVATPLLYGGAAARAEAHARADEVLRECGLAPWSERRPDDVPPNVRQAAVIARAIARRPELLVLEDPLSAMGVAQAERLLEACRRAARTVFIAMQSADGPVQRFADLTVGWNSQQPGHHDVGPN